MSTKKDLQLILKTFGYDLNTNTSKDTLLNLLHLHSKALKQGIDVPKMNDRELHSYLNKYNIITGPIISHTRIIYQHQLLQAIDNQINHNMNDKVDHSNENFSTPSINPDDGIVTRSGKILLRNVK